MARSIVSSPVDPIKDYGETIVACGAPLLPISAAPSFPPVALTLSAVRDGFYVNSETFDQVSRLLFGPERDTLRFPLLFPFFSLLFSFLPFSAVISDLAWFASEVSRVTIGVERRAAGGESRRLTSPDCPSVFDAGVTREHFRRAEARNGIILI